MNCPNCGKKLTVLVGIEPDSAPYACFDCVRGWWPAEMTPKARACWDPVTRSHGSSEVGQVVRLEAQVNRDIAVDEARKKDKP